MAMHPEIIEATANSPRLARDLDQTPESRTISRAELAERLSSLRGTTFATITAETDPRMVKKHRETGEPNPYLGTVKISRVNATIGADYERSVNRQRTREELQADFESMGLPDYYEPVNGPVIRHKHKGTLYLACKPETCYSVTYLDPKGRLVDADDVKPYLPASKPDSGRQGTDKAIVWRTYALDSIREVVLDKQHYVIAS